jgi:hypothetical protein
MMDWRAALEIMVTRTGHARYRTLCADDHPDHCAWRRLMLRLAGANEDPAARRAAKPRGPLGAQPGRG